MRPKTADERERRTVQYLLTLHKGQLGEFRLRRTNTIANFRHDLMAMLNKLIEARAEDLAAAMLMEHAPERPSRLVKAEFVKGRLPLPERKRRIPVWVTASGKAARNA